MNLHQVMTYIQNNWFQIFIDFGFALNVIAAGTRVMGWSKLSQELGKIEDALTAMVQASMSKGKPPVASIAVCFLLLSTTCFAQSTNNVDISSIISKLTLHEAVAYDIKSGNMTSYTSADILDYKGFSLSGGYSTSSAIVASLDYDLGGLSAFGITSPLLSIIDLRIGMMAGLSNISSASSSGSAERNKLCWGPEVTLVSIKF